MPSYRVVLLPGSVLPAEPAYGALIDALGADGEVVAKDLEVYATPEPPQDYSLELEVEGVLREADARGWQRFHLVGYSGGGAAALAVAAGNAERLWSLGLLEPAWAGNWDQSPTEQALWAEYDRLGQLPSAEFMREFMRLGVRPDVELPPPPAGEPPPWMAKRPAGIEAFIATFRTYQLDRASLERFPRPVYYALGGRSNPDQYDEIATRLRTVFPDFELEVFDDRHHLDPPHRIEPARLAATLRRVWERAERAA